MWSVCGCIVFCMGCLCSVCLLFVCGAFVVRKNCLCVLFVLVIRVSGECVLWCVYVVLLCGLCVLYMCVDSFVLR